MTKLFVKPQISGFFLSSAGIQAVERKYSAKYMGSWALRNKNGGWTETPVDVFYQPNPDTSKGHKKYFGIFMKRDPLFSKEVPMICDATSAFEQPLVGVVCEDGEVLISRFVHDYRTKGDRMIDGGRDYVRRSIHPTATVDVVDGEFVVRGIDE